LILEGATVPLIQLTAESEAAGERIDTYLAQANLGLSRSFVKRLLGEKRVTVDGGWIKPSYRIVGGEMIAIDKPDEKRIEFAAEEIPLDIRYEDDYLAVVNKPAGLVTHPAPGHEIGTLANALLHHFTSLSSGYVRGYPGLVHRLDKNTSGLLVVAKSDSIHRKLAMQLEQRNLTREYTALIWGKMQPRSGTIEVAIGRSRADRRVMTSGSPIARDAVTHYETVEEFEFLSLLKVHLETGRTHQIRAHLKEAGHPVFGDPEYGGRSTRLSGIEARHRRFAEKLLEKAERQLLHATRISFVHPETEEKLDFVAEIPEDFRQTLESVRQYR
jgi:23S rRNA pseudouridine1911/1915/1917 synthase